MLKILKKKINDNNWFNYMLAIVNLSIKIRLMY